MKKTDRYCQHPNHENYLKTFLKKYPTTNKDSHFAVNLVDPAEWYVSDDPNYKMLSDVWYFRKHCKDDI